jgi:hypothetical protein
MSGVDIYAMPQIRGSFFMTEASRQNLIGQQPHFDTGKQRKSS